jgi:cytochrome c-type biogenesis protein CcmH/NrfF
VLWFDPLALLVAGVLALFAAWRRRRRDAAAPPMPLSADERRRLTSLLDEGG